VGIRSAHDVWTNALELVDAQRAAAPGMNARRMSPLSPWATRGALAHIDFDPTVFSGRDVGPVSGSEALRCAPVKKGRGVLHSVIASRPLVAITTDPATGADVQLRGDAAPTWLYRTDTGISPQQRMRDILDDHLLYEASVLAVLRGTGPELGGRGAILDAVHLPYEGWKVDDDGFLLVADGHGDWQQVDPDAVIYIPGPSAGLTVEAQDEVRQWRSIARNIAIRLASPAPSIILEDPDAASAEDDEVDELVANAAAARRSPDGGVMYVGNMKPTVVQNNDDSGLFIASRNALRIDFANHLNLPVAVLDGSPATASLTYSTKAGARDELADLSLDYWTTPIVAALSQDEVVPRGTRVRFDFADLYAPTNAPTGAVTQD
jgi:hypothetical protein